MQKIYFNLFILSLLFSSCNYGLYTPTSPVIATVSEQGEVNGSLNFNYSKTSETQANITYCPISNFAVSANGTFGSFHNSTDVAIGYYTNKKITGKSISYFDIYLGGGSHNQKSNYEYYNEFSFINQKVTYSSNYNKFFGRVGYNYYKDRFGFSVSGQYNLIDYGKITRISENNIIEPFLKKLILVDYLHTFEISPSISFGPKHAKLVIGNTLIIGTNVSDSVDYMMSYAGFRFNLNYIFSKTFINELKKKETK